MTFLGPGASPGRLLHLGCGRDTAPVFFSEFQEVRFDIDPEVEPDIVGDITDLGDIGEFDAIYSSHVLEHVFEYQVGIALKEMYRVLKPGGFVMINVPNLDGVLPNGDVQYISPVGPITGLDMYYGHTGMVKDNPYMAHKTGFVPAKLEQALSAAGFRVGACKNIGTKTLMGIGVKDG